MTALTCAAHNAARRARRVRGQMQIRQFATSGVAPTAVRDAIDDALNQLPDVGERAIIDQIEAKRAELAASTQQLEFRDFGAGAGGNDPAPAVSRTLGTMTLASKPPAWAYLLFRLVRELDPATGVELGACVGISAAYQAAALHLNSHGGRLISLEGAEVLADRSNLTLKELGLDEHAQVRTGPFVETLAPTLAELKPIQWAFIDGHHDEAATLRYMEQILPSCAEEAVLVFDDIRWSPGMRRAWRAIATDPRFRLTVDLRSIGIAVLSADRAPREERSVSYW